jgi:dynein heavy chain, axonemal
VKNGAFVSLCAEVVEDAADWEAYVAGGQHFNRHFETMPCNFGARLTPFEKLLLIKIFKPEKIAESLSTYLDIEIGKEFASSPVSSIENLFSASDCSTPIIFVLSQGVDPTFQVLDYAKKKGTEIRTMSLGQG